MDIDVEGYLSADEFILLFTIAHGATDAIVEIGSYRGLSTVALAQGSQAPVYAIDPHEPFIAEDGTIFEGGKDRQLFMRNLLRAKVAHKVHLINLPSLQVARCWTQPIDILWIDGDHREKAVRADVRAWLPFVKINGMILLHDIHLPGVQAAMQDIEATALFEHIEGDIPIAQYGRLYA